MQVENIVRRLQQHISQDFVRLPHADRARHGPMQTKDDADAANINAASKNSEEQKEKGWMDFVSPRRVDEIQKLIERVQETHETHLNQIAQKVTSTHVVNSSEKERKSEDLYKELEMTKKAMEAVKEELQGELDTIHRTHEEEMAMVKEGCEHKVKRLKNELVTLRRKYESELQTLREKYQRLLESTSSEVDRQLEIQQKKLASRALLDLKGRQKTFESEMEVLEGRLKTTEEQNKELKDSISRLRIEHDMRMRELRFQLQESQERYSDLRVNYSRLAQEFQERVNEAEGSDESPRGGRVESNGGGRRMESMRASSVASAESSFSRPASRGLSSSFTIGRRSRAKPASRSSIHIQSSFHSDQRVAYLEKKLRVYDEEQQKLRETIVFLVRQLKEKGRMTHSFATSPIMVRIKRRILIILYVYLTSYVGVEKLVFTSLSVSVRIFVSPDSFSGLRLLRKAAKTSKSQQDHSLPFPSPQRGSCDRDCSSGREAICRQGKGRDWSRYRAREP